MEVVKGFKEFMFWLLGMLVVGLGGFDELLRVLLIFMSIDVFVLVIKSIRSKELNSKDVFERAEKKAIIITMVIMAVCLDSLAGFSDTNFSFRIAVVYFYIGYEGLSILENAESVGIPVHSKIREILKNYGKDNKE